MTNFTVWHRNTPSFMDNSPRTLAEFPKGFTPVAIVTTDEVGSIFQHTNSIDSPWYDNGNPAVFLTPEGMALFKKNGGIRSTSVGDIYTAENRGAYKTGRWTVEGIGLHEF